MRLSQLLKVMDKDEEVMVYDYRHNILQKINNKPLYNGIIRGIVKDNPINKGHVKYVLPIDNRLLVEIEVTENENTI